MRLGSVLLEKVLLPAVLLLQAWTLTNIVDVRERVARLEVALTMQAPRRGALEVPVTAAGGQGGPELILGQPVDDRREQRLEIVAGGEGPATRHAELYDRLRSRGAHPWPAVVTNEPGRVTDLGGEAIGSR